MNNSATNAQNTQNAPDTQTGAGAGASQPPAPTVWPTLQAHDALALIDFLVEKVGFRRTAVYADGDQVAHAQLDWPEGGGVMLGSHKPGGEWTTTPGTSGCYVVTADVDGLYERVKAAGVTIDRPLRDEDYGNRDFTIRDTEGNLWCFGVYPGEAQG
ncbi:VOC family protein [Streptomyces albidus (ex Kaewkla and Franco 2022)]|uniref:VOC family protein n=1 Tax=Streptomyces albidus (ex Kaewkla and Franco 2022) TaxID=722709 RepID=UPI0015EF20C3|nr:VOC family protein [Streptomyces albidus (ex Kaewkla and Franco 2022)]